MNRLNKWSLVGLTTQARLAQAEVPNFGASSDPFPAADAAAWSLVALLMFCISCFGLCACVLTRRFKSSLPNGQEREDHYQPTQPSGSPIDDEKRDATPENPPWEKDSDWWKK